MMRFPIKGIVLLGCAPTFPSPRTRAQSPNSAAIARTDIPAAPSLPILARSTTSRGRERCSVFPRRRNFEIAAVARSDRRTRSCLVIVARIDSTASRNSPQESRYSSVKLRQFTPYPLSRSRWFSVADTPSDLSDEAKPSDNSGWQGCYSLKEAAQKPSAERGSARPSKTSFNT
jgi:hypothetical protein